MTTINISDYNPNTAPFARDESLSWPDEIHLDRHGSALAVHPDHEDEQYTSLDELLDAYQIDADHLVEWLSEQGHEIQAQLRTIHMNAENDPMPNPYAQTGSPQGLLADEELDWFDDSYAPVILESPYAGDRATNERYLQAAIRDCIARGEAPFASHRMYTAALDDNIEAERDAGIRAGFAWRALASKTVVYIDLGISPGMQDGIQHARAIGHDIERRSLPSFEPKPCLDPELNGQPD